MRMRIDIPPSAKSRARAMHAEPTDAERQLWHALRDRRMQALKFRQQAPVGPYIVDFLCIAHQLVVEADGSQHAESKRDAKRDEWLAEVGYEILRFSHGVRFAVVRRARALIRRAFGTPPSPASGRREK